MIVYTNNAYGKKTAMKADTIAEVKAVFALIEPEVLSWCWYDRELQECAELLSKANDPSEARSAVTRLLQKINEGEPTDSFENAEFILVE